VSPGDIKGMGLWCKLSIIEVVKDPTERKGKTYNYKRLDNLQLTQVGESENLLFYDMGEGIL
jgi:hypothetical protein